MRRFPHVALCLALALASSAGVADELPAVRQPASKPAPKPVPLDLTIGDIHLYLPAEVLATPARDELEEIIVNGQRPEPLPEHRALPHSMIGALFYAGSHPLDAWRVLVPDPYFEIPDRTEDDTKDPP